MAKQLQDRYTAVGLGGVRETAYDRATVPEVSSNAIDEPGTRDILYGLRPNLDSMPRPVIETIDDTDVINRPWDAASEIQQVSNMVMVEFTFPRLTLVEAMTIMTLAMSEHDHVVVGTNTKVMATPKNKADNTDLYSTSITVNSDPGVGPSMEAAAARSAATYANPSAAFNPGIIRAYDGFFVNSFELTLERGTERLFNMTVQGYASGSYNHARAMTLGTDWFQNHYRGAELTGHTTQGAANFSREYVDSRLIQPDGAYLRGTQTKAYLAFTDDANATLAQLSAATARRLSSRAFIDRSTELSTENLLPTGSNQVDGPALIDLNNIAYTFRLAYNNNVDIEDLLRWGGGNRITAAEKQLASIEISMEFDLQDYSYFQRLIEDYNMALQVICAPDADHGMGLFFPLLRQSENTLSRRGIKRTQQMTLMPLGRERATSPFYADFKVPTSRLSGGKLFPLDDSVTVALNRS